MPYSVALPDGRIAQFPDDMPQEQAAAIIRKQFPPTSAPIGGLRGELGASTERMGSELVTGIQSLLGNANQAAVDAQKREESISKRYDTESSLEKIKKAYNAPEGGLFSAARTAVGEVPSTIASMAPQLAEMAGPGALGAMVAGPVGGAIGAGLGLGAQYLQSIGAGVTSQAAEQQKQGKPVDVNVGRAAAFAVPETALNYAHLIPLGAKTVASAFGPRVAGLLDRGLTKEANAAAQAKLADEGFWKTLGRGTAEGAAINTPLMVAQTALGRAQSGQDLFSDDALAAYGGAATSALLGSPIGAVGSFQARGAARDAVAAQNALADAEAQKAKDAELQAKLNDPNYPQQVAQQYADLQKQFNSLKAAKDVKVAADDFAGKDAKKEAALAFKEFLNKPENQGVIDEYKRIKSAGLLEPKAPEQAPTAQASLFSSEEAPVPTTPELNLRGQPLQRAAQEVPTTDPRADVAALTAQIENLQKAAVNVTDPAKFDAVAQQHQTLTDALEKAQAEAAKLPDLDALSKRLAENERQFRIAREQGDIQKANEYAKKVQDLLNQGAGQTRIPGSLNKKLFGSETEKSFNTRMSAEELAKRQADLLAQNEGVPPAAPEGEPNVTSYLQSLDQLDEMRKQGASEAEIARAQAEIEAMEARRLDTSRTSQGMLFPAEAESVVNTGGGKAPEKTRAQLMQDFQAAKQTRDRLGMQNAIEQMRIMDERSKARSEAARGIGPTGELTDAETAKQLAGTGLTVTGSQPTTFERSFTRKTVTPEELRAQIAAMPENLPANAEQLLNRVLANFNAFATNKDRANMLADWLYKTRTAQLHPDVITAPDVFRERTLKNELDKLDYANRQKQPGLFTQAEAPLPVSKAETEALGKPAKVERPQTQTDREAVDAAKRKEENERAERLAAIPGESVTFEALRKAQDTLERLKPRLEELREKAADKSLPKTTRDKANRQIKQLALSEKFISGSREGNQEARLQATEELAKLQAKIKKQEAAVAENDTKSRKQELAKSKRREAELNRDIKSYQKMAERTPIETPSAREKAKAEAMANEFLDRYATLEQDGTLGKLPARKIGPMVRNVVVAGDVRTGLGETAGERTLGGRNPAKQAGQTRPVTTKEAIEVGNKTSADKVAAGKPLTKEEIQALDLLQHNTLIEAADRVRMNLQRNLDDVKARIEFAKNATNKALQGREHMEPLEQEQRGIERDLANAKDNLSKLQGEEDAFEPVPKGRGPRSKKYIAQKAIEGYEGPEVDDAAVYRVDDKAGPALREEEVKRFISRIIERWTKVPEIVFAPTFESLPDHIKNQAHKDGVADRIPGVYDPKTKTAYIVGDRMHTAEDVIATVAHEVTGHFGLREVLGDTYTKTMNDLYDGNRAVRKAADEKLANSKTLTKEIAVEEVLAEIAENPKPDMAERSALRRAYDAVKDWFNKTFRGQKMSDEAVQQIVANARRYVIEGVGKGEGEAPAPKVNFKTAKYAPGLSNAGKLASEVVAGEKPMTERYTGMSFGRDGLELMTKLVDQFAPLARASRLMDSLAGTQMMHDLRMVGQRMNLLGQVVGRGPLERVEITRADGKKEWVYQAREGSSLVGVNKILSNANKLTGGQEETNNLFSLYSIAKRAERVGLERLNYDKTITREKLKEAMNEIKSVNGLERIFDTAHNEYQKFNRGLIDFAVKTRFLSKADAAKMNASADYVPYYRENDKGEVSLMMGSEEIARVGNIKGQPYLHELIGDNKRILDFNTSAVRNANMLLEMGLRNQAALGVAHNLREIGMAVVGKGSGSGPNIFNYKQDGESYHAMVKDSKDIPADLLVKGMEGIPVQTSSLLRLMGMPSRLVRQMFVANPVSAGRILFKDTISSAMTAGSNLDSIGAAFKNVGDSLMERRGLSGGEVFQGMPEDMSNILREIQSGKPGWETLLAKAHVLHAKADSMTRQIRYESYRKQGLSDMEASYMALESMNFTRRGISPSIHVLNTLNPFINSQIQGINTLVQSMRGTMPFNEKLKIREKIFQRGMLVAGGTMLYAALMQDDKTYKNSLPDQKYNNWFVHFPGVDEAVRVPIPFEAGMLFKSVPEALVNAMYGKGEDAAEGLKQTVQKMIPGGDTLGIPLALRPAIEAHLGKSFYTGRDLESRHEASLQPGERSRPGTSAFADSLGSELNVSPVKIDHLIQGYTGGLGLAIMNMASSLVFGKQGAGNGPETKLSGTPIIGNTFQPEDAGAVVDQAYKTMNEISQVAATYKDKLTKDPAAAAAYLNRYAEEFNKSGVASTFTRTMAEFAKQRQAILLNKQMTPVEKRAAITNWEDRRTAYAQQMMNVAQQGARP